MEEQGSSCDNLPVRPCPEDLISTSNSEKIRRPPNAFMLFGKEHRKNVAEKHPEIANKEISGILGSMWKNLPVAIKEKYHSKAKQIGELHKKHYPDYVYSPIEARLKKMEKKKKKDEAFANLHKIKKSENNPSEAGQTVTHNRYSVASSEYVPNNPEYFTETNPDLSFEEDEEKQYPEDRDSQKEMTGGIFMIKEKQPTHSQTDFRCHMAPDSRFCSRSDSNTGTCCFPPYRIQQASSCFPETPQYPHATSPFYGPTEHLSGSTNTFCCPPPTCCNQVPRTYRPPYQPYWNPRIINPPLYNQGRDRSYGDPKAFAYPTPYCASEYCRPPFGYFNKPFMHYCRNSNCGFHPQFNEDIRHSQASENEVPFQNSEYNTCFSQSNEKERLSCLQNSSFGGELYPQNGIFPASGYQTTGYLPSFVESQPKQETPKCFHPSYVCCDKRASKVIKNECIDTEISESNAPVILSENQSLLDSKCSSSNSEGYLSEIYVDETEKPPGDIFNSTASQDSESSDGFVATELINSFENVDPSNSSEMNAQNHNKTSSYFKSELTTPELPKINNVLIKNEFPPKQGFFAQSASSAVKYEPILEYIKRMSKDITPSRECNLAAFSKSLPKNEADCIPGINAVHTNIGCNQVPAENWKPDNDTSNQAEVKNVRKKREQNILNKNMQ